MNESTLIKLKKRIDRAKEKLSELKGKKEYQIELLKEKFNVSTLQSARKLKDKLEKELDKERLSLQEQLHEIEDAYGHLLNEED